MDLKIRNGGPVVTLAPESRYQTVLQPTSRMWNGMYTIMSLIGYERCATCMGRINPSTIEVEGHLMYSYECLSCHTGCAKVVAPDGSEVNYDCFALRGTILPYVCARRTQTLLERPYFPHHGVEGDYFGARWTGDLYTSLAPLGLYVLKYAFSDAAVCNRIGGHLSMVRVAGPPPNGCYTHSNWLVLNTTMIGVTGGTTISDWDGLRRRLSMAEYTAFEPSLRMGIDVANELAERRRAPRPTTNATRNEFKAILRTLGVMTKQFKADPAWQAKVEKTLAGFGDVKKLLK